MQEIQWSPIPVSDEPSHNALLALKAAAVAAQNFDVSFKMKHPERESSVPLLDSQEIVVDFTKIRPMGYYREVPVKAVLLNPKLTQGKFGKQAQIARERLANRVSESPYFGCKFLQQGLVDQSDHGPTAAAEMITEVKMLMNLEPHPNVSQIYGCNAKGIDAFLDKGFHSFFFITDRLQDTLAERIDKVWRKEHVPLHVRLEIGLDISSALRFLHHRKIVYYLRPAKVGFDLRHNGRIKLCHFSQARQEGMKTIPTSISKSDDVKNTLAYTAPEALCNAPTTCSSDVYAFGIMLWEMVTLHRPFNAYDRSRHYAHAVQGHERPSLNKIHSRNLMDLLSTAWQPHLRPTIKTLNGTLEMMLLSDNQDDVTINLPDPVAATKQQPFDIKIQPSGPIRSARSSSKIRKLVVASSQSARLSRTTKLCSDDTADARGQYQRSASLNKLNILRSKPQSVFRYVGEDESGDTTPTARSNGSVETDSAGHDGKFASPLTRSGRVTSEACQDSPHSQPKSISRVPIRSGRSAKRRSNASGTVRSDVPSSGSTPGGTFSESVPWKTMKTYYSAPTGSVVQGEPWAPFHPPAQASIKKYVLSTSTLRKHRRSASMGYAPAAAISPPTNSNKFNSQQSPFSAASPVSPIQKEKRRSQRRASISGPPSTEFKLDMIPQPTLSQSKLGSVMGRTRSPKILSHVGQPKKSTSLSKIGFDSSPESSRRRVPRRTVSADNPLLAEPSLLRNPIQHTHSANIPSISGQDQPFQQRGKSPSARSSRRILSIRKSKLSRDGITLNSLPTHHYSLDGGGNTAPLTPLDGDDSPVIRRTQQRREGVFRKSTSGRHITKAIGIRNVVADDDGVGVLRDNGFSARLRAELKKDPSSVTSKVIRVKVKSKTPSS